MKCSLCNKETDVVHYKHLPTEILPEYIPFKNPANEKIIRICSKCKKEELMITRSK